MSPPSEGLYPSAADATRAKRPHVLADLLKRPHQRREVALDGLRRRLVVLFDGQAQQLAGVSEAVGHAIERADDLLQAGALTPQLLGLVGRVPDLRVFQFPAYFGEPLALGVVFKGTSSARRCAR